MNLVDWVAGSNAIEGILRPPNEVEIAEHQRLLSLPQLTVVDLERFVASVADGAELRCQPGMNVRVGNHVPVLGSPEMRDELQGILDGARDEFATPYRVHTLYEWLHPFMDGNGRSGRALWAWQMNYRGEDPFALPFLHAFYYQSLEVSR